MREKDTKCNITERHVTIPDLIPPKKKRGHGYTKSICKKAKSNRRGK